MAQTNFNLIDPNKTILQGNSWSKSDDAGLGIPAFEDIRSFVEMSFRPKNINFFEIGPDGVASSSKSQDSSIVTLNGHYKKGNSEYYSTNYTDELMGDNLNPNKMYEGFGIKSVDITFDANKVPQVTVTFYDLRGNVINDFNSSYAKMFQLPYPKFTLKVKGGFGPSVKYDLLKIKDDISIDEMGNYIITSKFIGDKFAPFSDLPLLYLMAVPYLKGITVNQDITLDNKITSFHELIIGSKRLFERVAEVKDSDTELGNQRYFTELTENLTNLNDSIPQFEDQNEFYKWFQDIEPKNKILPFLQTVVFDKKNYEIIFNTTNIFNLEKADYETILTTAKAKIDSINGGNKLVEYEIIKASDVSGTTSLGLQLLTTYDILFKIKYGLLIKERENLEKDAKEKGFKFSEDYRIKMSELPYQFLGETRLTIGTIFRIMLEDYNFLMKKIYEVGNKGYKEIVDTREEGNKFRKQQTFDKMGFPTVIQKDGNGSGKIIYPGLIPDFQNWPEIKFIEEFIEAYYRSVRATAIADSLLNKQEDGSSKYIPINPREYYKSTKKEDFVDNIYFGKETLEIYKLIYQRFLCFANININLDVDSSVYTTWKGSQNEDDDWIAWTKDLLGLVDFNDKNIQRGLFYSIINMEARNIAYAVSLNEKAKKAILDLSNTFKNDYFVNNTGSELTRSIETIVNNTLSIQSIPTNNTPLVLAPTNTTPTTNLGLQLTTPTTSQFTNNNAIQPFDDNYVTVSQAGPTLIGVDASTSADYITDYMFKINKANSTYKITRDNILYIPDKKLEGNNNESDYYFDSNKPDNEFIILTNPYVDNQSQAFDFKKFFNNCRYTGLVQIPKGMLIVLANLLRQKETTQQFSNYDNGQFLYIVVNSGIYSPTFVIRKNSSFYTYLENLWTEAYSPDKGFSINYINNNGDVSVVVRKDATFADISETETDLIEKIKKYIYEPVYVSINDIRFAANSSNGGIQSNTTIKNGVTNTTDSNPTLYKQYLSLLFKKAAEFIKIDDENLAKKLKSFDSYIKDPEVKLSVYKSFQVIYENYLHGVSEDDFKQTITNDKNTSTFLFVDRGYNDISDLCILDIKTLLNDVNDYEVSLLSSMARLLADNNFWFYPFQSFVTTENDYNKLFEINYDKEAITKPKFVAMYVGGLSSNPRNDDKLEKFGLQDDGIKIDNIPADLTTSGNSLNAFLVKYTGIQNQSVFSNLQVSTESLKNTDEGLRIQSEIIGNASNSFTIPKGQSLLNVYQKQSYSSTVKIPFGNIALQPTNYYYQEFVPLFDGLYIIYNVTHNIDADTQRLETTFKGYRLKKDTNPIVTQQFVDFLNNNIYTQGLNDLNLVILTSGPQLAPIRNLISQGESNGDYEIYNFGKDGASGIRSITRGSNNAIKLTDKTLQQIINYQADANFNFFAVGKYQFIPKTLKETITKAQLDKNTTKFDVGTQDKLCDTLLLGDTDIRRYLVATSNEGTQQDLERAVQAIAEIWAAMPVISKTSKIVGKFGDVVTGNGNKGYYGGTGINPDTVSINVKSVVQALITSRIQYSGKIPRFIPTYYVNSTNSTILLNNDAKFVTIGDSLSIGLTLYSKKITKITQPSPLSIGGKKVEWLLDELVKIKQPKSNIPNLIISIGANNGYQLTGKEDKLINEIKRVFPSSKKFIINGSYGWDKLKVTQDKTDLYWTNQINTFIKKFKDKDFEVLGDIVKENIHPQGNKNDPFFNSIFAKLNSFGL